MTLITRTLGGIFLMLGFFLSACSASGASQADQLTADGQVEYKAEDFGLTGDGLKIFGLVDSPSVWSGEQLRDMEMIEVVYLPSSGGEAVYQGVPIIVIMGLVGVQDWASSLVIRTENGSESEIRLDQINACIDCIVAPGTGETFDVVLPGNQPQVVIPGVEEFVLR